MPTILASEFRKYHDEVFAAPSIPEAIEMGRLLLEEGGGLLLVTGSLYTVAEALRWVEHRKE